jgi:hypothetical protein
MVGRDRCPREPLRGGRRDLCGGGRIRQGAGRDGREQQVANERTVMPGTDDSE